MNSEPLIEKNRTSASPATALAMSVLHVPGGAQVISLLEYVRRVFGIFRVILKTAQLLSILI